MNIRIDGIFYTLEAQSDRVLDALLKESRDRFYICAMAKNKNTEIERTQDKCSSDIQAIKAEIERREMRKAA